jgi:hypothetical protein
MITLTKRIQFYLERIGTSVHVKGTSVSTTESVTASPYEILVLGTSPVHIEIHGPPIDPGKLDSLVATIGFLLESGSVSQSIPPPVAHELRTILDLEIYHLDLSSRTENWLLKNNIKFVGQLVPWTERALLKRRSVGEKGLKEITDAVASMNLQLGMDVGEWTPPTQRPTAA